MSTEPITLTSEQVISLVGHGVTHKQLDGFRQELASKLDRTYQALDSKLDQSYQALDSKLDQSCQALEAKLDTHLKWMVGMWLTTIASIIGLAFHG